MIAKESSPAQAARRAFSLTSPVTQRDAVDQWRRILTPTWRSATGLKVAVGPGRPTAMRMNVLAAGGQILPDLPRGTRRSGWSVTRSVDETITQRRPRRPMDVLVQRALDISAEYGETCVPAVLVGSRVNADVLASVAGGVLATLLGVVVGAVLARRAQFEQWSRDRQVEACVSILRESTNDEAWAAIRDAMEDARLKFTNVTRRKLVGSSEPLSRLAWRPPVATRTEAQRRVSTRLGDRKPIDRMRGTQKIPRTNRSRQAHTLRL
jgi:hypothetical protein